MKLKRLGLAAVMIVVAAAGWGAPATAAAPAVTLISNTVVDPAALYFESYQGLVNNESFQQSGILSYAGYQYASWYTANRSVVVGRRALPGGTWQTLTLPHQLTANDSHNVISLGISTADGRLHVAMDTHDTVIFYAKSEAGLVSAPAGHAWVAGAFGSIQRTLDGAELGTITYPRFLAAPGGVLQLSYRTGVSGNGTEELAEYDVAGGWTKLGRWQSAAGTYGVSTTRNLYPHGFTYDRAGRLHAAFTWREGGTGVLCSGGGLSNHDTDYVYSDDRGRTWHNDAGAVVARTGGTPQLALDSPGIVVDPLDVDHALMNDESQDVDSAGNPHVAISYVPGRYLSCVSSYASQRAAYARLFHLYRDAAGVWRKAEVPEPLGSTNRSQLMFDSHDNLYVVMPYGRIVSASAASGWTDWTVRFDGTALNAFGEVLIDRSRIEGEDVLSVLYQQRSSGTTPPR
ncbi:BNR repeat-containing protein [Paractinoplanes durhamensis]|uniref:BNR repeat-containing protein n=1 Tax=Paractinoplanes durhamensis TaxID=113563 RepID=UPI003626BF1C